MKKIVVTSSIVAIGPEKNLPKDHVYSEKDFGTIDKVVGYRDSKIIEDDHFREFAKSQSECEVVIINPGWIFGPTLINVPFSTAQFLMALFLGIWKEIPAVVIPLCSLQDTVEAHIQAMLKPNLHGERFVVVQETWTIL